MFETLSHTYEAEQPYFKISVSHLYAETSCIIARNSSPQEVSNRQDHKQLFDICHLSQIF